MRLSFPFRKKLLFSFELCTIAISIGVHGAYWKVELLFSFELCFVECLEVYDDDICHCYFLLNYACLSTMFNAQSSFVSIAIFF